MADRLITCRLGDGITTRRAVCMTVRGHALLGPAIFPTWRPQTFGSERAQLTANRGWVIRRAGTRASTS